MGVLLSEVDMYGYPMCRTEEEEKQYVRTLSPKDERRRNAVLWSTFGEITARAQAFGRVPTENLLDQIETLCAECREVLATSEPRSSVQDPVLS